ncbi:MAG: YfcE family phosphodiesterase [Candidatus Edwardsbacteria bacterium]
MKIGVVSDTHGNIEYLKKVIDKFHQEGVEIFIHLGDDITDLEGLKEPSVEWIEIPGVYEPIYVESNLPHRVIKEFEGLRFLLTHSPTSHPNDFPSDIKPEEVVKNREVDVILYGHTHKPELKEEEGVLWVNPGHLKKEDKKGFPPSYAILECNRKRTEVKIIDFLQKKIIFSKIFLVNRCNQSNPYFYDKIL